MKNKRIHVRANAKVNLALHVVGQETGGFHLLDSLVAFPAFGDELIFEKAEGLSLSVSGPFGRELLKDTRNSSNIVIRAAELLKDSNNGAAIELIKNIPVASGIGGGSSNAAMTLKALSQLWKTKIPLLDEILKLGSDVPVCFSNGLQRMQGVGGSLTLLPQPSQMWIILANPRIKVSTQKIFGFLQNKNNEPLERLDSPTDQNSFFGYLKRQRNDLEKVTCGLFPEVAQLLEIISNTANCMLSRMSGSGATCFGLYSEERFAFEAVDIINKKHPEIWVVSAPLFLSHSSHNKVT